VLVTALNPLRVALAVRTPERASGAEYPAPSPGRVALGGAAGAAFVLVGAVLADSLATALHISSPALRLAAGVVALVAGVVTVFVSPPSAAPLGPDRPGVAVPVAVAVASPALVTGALAAALDRGLPVVVAALVAGVAALVAAVVVGAPAGARGGRRDPRARLLLWGGRLTGAVLVATAVLLILDAAYAP
jgi:hypothetical protein